MTEKKLTCPRCGTVSPISAGKCLGCGLAMVKKKKAESKAPAPQSKELDPAEELKLKLQAKLSGNPIPQTPQGRPAAPATQRPPRPKNPGPPSIANDTTVKIKRPTPAPKPGGRSPEPPLGAMTGIERFGAEDDESTSYGAMSGIERTGQPDSPSARPPQKATAAVKKSPKKRPPQQPSSGNSDKTESILDLLEDTADASGDFFAQNQNSAPQVLDGDRLELVQRAEAPEEKAPLEPEPEQEPETTMASKEEILQDIRKGNLMSRVFTRVVPQVVVLIALGLFGTHYIQGIVFEGLWKGQVTSENGRSIDFELKVERAGNTINGKAYFFAPQGESIFTLPERSSVPMTVLQVMDDFQGNFSGTFNRDSAKFTVRPGDNISGFGIEFAGNFSNKDQLQGEVVNSMSTHGAFSLRRVR